MNPNTHTTTQPWSTTYVDTEPTNLPIIIIIHIHQQQQCLWISVERSEKLRIPMQKSQSNYAVAFASQTHNEHKKQTFLLKQTHRTKQTQELQSLIQCINKQKQIKKREPKRKKEKDLFKTTKKLVAQIVGSFWCGTPTCFTGSTTKRTINHTLTQRVTPLSLSLHFLSLSNTTFYFFFPLRQKQK